MAENDSFVFYLEWIDYLEMLPPDKAMEILKAIVGLIRDEKTVQFTDPGQNFSRPQGEEERYGEEGQREQQQEKLGVALR